MQHSPTESRGAHLIHRLIGKNVAKIR